MNYGSVSPCRPDLFPNILYIVFCFRSATSAPGLLRPARLPPVPLPQPAQVPRERPGQFLRLCEPGLPRRQWRNSARPQPLTQGLVELLLADHVPAAAAAARHVATRAAGPVDRRAGLECDLVASGIDVARRPARHARLRPHAADPLQRRSKRW